MPSLLRCDCPPLRLAWIRRDAHVAAPTVDVAAIGAGDKVRRATRRSPLPRTSEKPDDHADRGHRRDRDQQPEPTRQTAAAWPPVLTPIAYERTIPADHGSSAMRFAAADLSVTVQTHSPWMPLASCALPDQAEPARIPCWHRTRVDVEATALRSIPMSMFALRVEAVEV